MPFLLAALGILAAAYFWYIRMRGAAEMATELMDVANDIRLAARRFGYRRRNNVHPVDSIDTPRLAATAIAQAFLELDNLPSKDQLQAMQKALQATYGVDLPEAEEMQVLGRWLVNEAGGPAQSVPRLAKRLVKIGSAEAFEPLMHLVAAVAGAGSGLSERQQDALDEVRKAFGIR